MKIFRLGAWCAALVCSLLHLHAAESKNCGCACCVGKEICCCEAADQKADTPAPAEKLAGHPLRGVIVDILPSEKALLVKHEEVPGVMKAMTMLLRVNDEALAAARKSAPVTGQLIRRGTVWWLDDVKVGVAKE